MRLALLLLALPAILAGCLGDQPPIPTPAAGQIDGAVVDHLLRPFANQSVTLVQLDRTDATSLLGGFTFRQVPVGFYTLTTVLEDGRGTTQVVQVEADKITRVILQILPPDDPLTRIDATGFQTKAEMAQAGQACEACTWSHPLDATERPAEVLLEASWLPLGLPFAGGDDLTIEVADDRGFTLYSDTVPPNARITIPGEDLSPEAKALQVRVWFGPQFMPRSTFEMESVLSLFYGATQDEMLHA